jgi:hypothetical protein
LIPAAPMLNDDLADASRGTFDASKLEGVASPE